MGNTEREIEWWCPHCGTLNTDVFDGGPDPYECEACGKQIAPAETLENERK